MRPRGRGWRLMLMGALVLAGLLAWPVPETLERAPLARTLVDHQGRLLAARIASDGQWRFAPGQDAVPDKFALALVTFEDRRFWQHPGIDPVALGRALRDNLLSRRVVSGASTLTMQLARQMAGHGRRTLLAKLDEAWLALRLELRHDKTELLALYSAHAPFGGNVVGLEAASWRYFQRAPEALTWAEAALLAVLPNNPSLMHPGRNRQALQDKRDRLLRRLHAEGRLSDLDLELALLEPLPGAPGPLPQQALPLLDRLAAQHPRQARFHTTLDAGLQQRLQRLAGRHGERLTREGIADLAVLVIDHGSARVSAYLTNHDRGSPQRSGAMVDLVQRPRSQGSLLKPFLYAQALDAGLLTPETLLVDVPTQFAGYRPENYDRQYRGAVSARQALSQSLNVPFVRLLREYGVARFHRDLQELGLTGLREDADHYGLALILGGAESSLWELAGLYVNLVRTAAGEDPAWTRLRLLQEEPLADLGRPLSRGAAWLTLEAMLEVTRPGDEALWRQFGSSQPVAWKTGTSFGFRDGWAIGSNGRWTVAVWSGNAEGQGVPTLTGSRAAAPLMLDLLNGLGARPWLPRPETALKAVRVCREDGFLVSAGCEARPAWIPVQSEFERISRWHRRIHLDAEGWRVHPGCERPHAMTAHSWFLLPPVMEHFWRARHPQYRRLPGWRADCLARLADFSDDQPMALLSPQEGGQVLLPVEMDGSLGQVMVRAIHRDSRAVLHWHLDQRYLGETRQFHDMALHMEPGWHRLRLVDQHGQVLDSWLRALARQAPGRRD